MHTIFNSKFSTLEIVLLEYKQYLELALAYFVVPNQRSPHFTMTARAENLRVRWTSVTNQTATLDKQSCKTFSTSRLPTSI
jgi:hypothetical protein